MCVPSVGQLASVVQDLSFHIDWMAASARMCVAAVMHEGRRFLLIARQR